MTAADGGWQRVIAPTASRIERDSADARNDLLSAVIYPDSDDPTDLSGPGTDGCFDRFDRVEYEYNR